MRMTAHTNSMDALLVVVSDKIVTNNKPHNWMVQPVAVTLISICLHSNCRHYHIGSSHYAWLDCSSHQNSCHLDYDSWHNEHLDPSSESMDAPKILAAQISVVDDYNANVHDVYYDAFESYHCYFHALDDENLFKSNWIIWVKYNSKLNAVKLTFRELFLMQKT